MKPYFTEPDIDLAAALIQKKTQIKPQVAVVLGSGLGHISKKLEQKTTIPYKEIPKWPISTVEGHAGSLAFGVFEKREVVFMQGRIHFYEGYPMQMIGFPIRVFQKLGISSIIMTNAVGAVNQSFEAGDLMLITDHISFLPMSGQNPLIGPNMETFGPRFPDMSQCYDRQLIKLAEGIALENDISFKKGVYFCLSGPNYETPADLKMINILGGDVVGMSTVPEVIVARHGGTKVLGISVITNKAKLDGSSTTTHAEVIETSAKASAKLEILVSKIINKI
jgi:purine-nucleoside phosphorylase